MSVVFNSPNVRRIAFISIVGMLFSLGIRLFELPAWSESRLFSEGEHLLATHDAYAWAAGAVSANAQIARSPSAELLRVLSDVLAIPPGEVAFWVAPILAVLAVLPLILWAEIIELDYLSLPIALLATLTPAYYIRTRLGYYDTDWATYFFPLLVSGLIATWIKLKANSFQTVDRNKDPGHVLLFLLLIISVILVGKPWHGFISFIVFTLLLCVVLIAGLIIGREQRDSIIIGLIVFTLTTLWGWIGIFFGVSLVSSTKLLQKRFACWIRLLLPILLALTLILLAQQVLPEFALQRLARYLPSLGSREIATGAQSQLIYPTLSSSVRETQRLDFLQTLEGMTFTWWLGFMGCVGFFLLLWQHPISLLLAPLALLGLSSLWLGARFAMFATPALLLGLGYLLKTIILGPRPSKGKIRRGIRILVFSLILMSPLLKVSNYRRLPVIAAVSRAHADALRALKPIAGARGVAWTWWDYGYATQYFSGLTTFADGGRNAGPSLYTLSRALTEQEITKAMEIIQFTAATEFMPWESWQECPPINFENCLDDLVLEIDEKFSESLHIILQWEAIDLLPWMTYYGSWDFSLQDGCRGAVMLFNEEVRIDLDDGRFLLEDGTSIDLESIDLIDSEHVEHLEYAFSRDGMHLLVNQVTQELFLLDDQV